ncbi:hypothetical protein BSNK01_18430 [Bacillaceae bacterium]
MKVSDLVAAQLTELKQTLSLQMFKAAQATEIAQATVMLEDFQKVQKEVQNRSIKPAPHPYAGQYVDVKL